MTVRSLLFRIPKEVLAAKRLSSVRKMRYTSNKMNLEPCQKNFFCFATNAGSQLYIKCHRKKTNIRLEKEGQYYVE